MVLKVLEQVVNNKDSLQIIDSKVLIWSIPTDIGKSHATPHNRVSLGKHVASFSLEQGTQECSGPVQKFGRKGNGNTVKVSEYYDRLNLQLEVFPLSSGLNTCGHSSI